MTIERALVGFFGAVSAATAASRASTTVPESVAADPAGFFQRLVDLRGETELRRHAERLALHVLGECKAGRATLGQLESRIVTLTSSVLAFPPKTTALTEAVERPTGRSAAAAALILASAIVSRAQARGRPEQTRLDPSWSTDMIAEALAGILAEPEFLAGVERAFAAASSGIAVAKSRKTSGALSTVQLREACAKHGVTASEMDAMIAAKTVQLRELSRAFAGFGHDLASDDVTLKLHSDASDSLAEGDLAQAIEHIAAIGDRVKAAGNGILAASMSGILGQLEDIRMEPRASANRYGEAYERTPRTEPVQRWGFALKQAGALASEADELAAAGLASNRPLAEAVRIYASALGLLPANDAPELRSVTHNSLGNTLLRLGEVEGKAELFGHAANSYRAATGFMNPDKSGREWALVESNLGTALLKGGELANSERNYEDAAAAYGRALSVLRPETDGADWAAAEAGRGMAEGRLGAIRGDLGMLERTARAVDAAIAQLDRKIAPAQWARLQSCLGNICADLGERISGRHWLERAITAYEAAQEEWTETRAPLQWALSEANRGGAHLGLGTLTASRRHLHLAEDCLAHAREVFLRLGQAAYAAAADQSLKAVRTELGITFAPVESLAPAAIRA